MSLTLSDLNFEDERTSNPHALLHGRSHLRACKLLIKLGMYQSNGLAVGQSVLRPGAWDILSHIFEVPRRRFSTELGRDRAKDSDEQLRERSP